MALSPKPVPRIALGFDDPAHLVPVTGCFETGTASCQLEARLAVAAIRRHHAATGSVFGTHPDSCDGNVLALVIRRKEPAASDLPLPGHSAPSFRL
jgi:hypothetical protein